MSLSFSQSILYLLQHQYSISKGQFGKCRAMWRICCSLSFCLCSYVWLCFQIETEITLNYVYNVHDDAGKHNMTFISPSFHPNSSMICIQFSVVRRRITILFRNSFIVFLFMLFIESYFFSRETAIELLLAFVHHKVKNKVLEMILYAGYLT